MATEGNDEIYREVRAKLGPEPAPALVAPAAAPPAPTEPRPRGPVYRLFVFLFVALSGWILLLIPVVIVGSLITQPLRGSVLEPVIVGLLGLLWLGLPILVAFRRAGGPDRGSIFPRTIRLLTGLETPADDPGRPLTLLQRIAFAIGEALGFVNRVR